MQYFTQVPIRYGDYIAKPGVFLATSAQIRLGKIDASNSLEAFEDAADRATKSRRL